MDELKEGRAYWAAKKAAATERMWETLHASRNLSVANAPEFVSSSDDDDDDDVKHRSPLPSESEGHKKLKKPKKHKKKTKSSKKRDQPSGLSQDKRERK